jgi:hypothetical protein
LRIGETVRVDVFGDTDDEGHCESFGFCHELVELR